MTQALLIAAAGFLSVGALTLTLGLLLSKKGANKALGFMVGYVTTYIVIGLVFVNFLSGSDVLTSDSSSDSPWPFVIIGCIFLALGIRNLIVPPDPNKKSGVSRFLSAVDKLTFKKTLLIGLGIPLINFKSLVIYISALSVLPLSSSGVIVNTIYVLLIAFIFCSVVILPNVVVYLLPAASKSILQKVKKFLERRSRQIVVYIPIILGLMFIVNAVII